ncbi:MAG: helix-turn-helix domain-containing protein, partial [bacterium]
MEILTYVQARELIPTDLTEEQVQMVLTVSGRAKEWIEKCSKAVSRCHSDTELVETSGMGRAILQQVPQNEWVYLVNPSLAPDGSQVVKEQLVRDGRIFAEPFKAWLGAQEIGLIYRLSEAEFTVDEARIVRKLWEKQEQIVDREEMAQVLWGEEWSTKYSDWALDALVSRLRKKMSGRWQIITIKGRGYLLAQAEKPTGAVTRILGKGVGPYQQAGSIYPSDEYLAYMNDQKRVRKVYRDLFLAMQKEKITNFSNSQINILCVNSYS